MANKTVTRPPRGWGYRARQSSDPEGNYQAVCGHYLPAGIYACQDCNLAPLNEWLALREALIEATECLEEIRATHVVMHSHTLAERNARAIDQAHALLEAID